MPSRKGSTTETTHNWEKLRREWLSSNLNLNEFAKHKGIRWKARFYQKAKSGGWEDQKRAIEVEIDKRLSERMVDHGVKEWEQEIALLQGIRSHVAFILKDHMDADGNVTSAIEPTELKALAEVVTKGVIARKHIKGEPVEGEKGGTTNFNFHAYAVQVVNQIEADADGPTPLTPPHLGHRGG